MKWLLASLVVAVPALAEPDLKACADVYSDCHDTCSLKFGVSLKDRIKLNLCINKCDDTEQECRDRFLETSVHGLDDGALKGTKKHDDDLREDNKKHAIVDDGSSTKSAQKKQRDDDLPKRTSTRAADLDSKPDSAAKPDSASSSTSTSKSSEPVAQKQAGSGLDSSVRDEDDKAKLNEAKKKNDSSDSSSSSRAKPKKEHSLDEWDPDSP